jgi:hypothetical protein
MRIDIGLGETGDLMIRDGDFVMGISDAQHVGLLVRLHKGNLKHEPLVGVGEKRLINGVVDGEIRREIQLQLESDGYRVKEIKGTAENLEIVV